MVTRWLALALLAVAVRRWPVQFRDELRAEWQAELHVLASPPQRGRMLRFSVSLALTRPRLGTRMPFFDQELTVGRVVRHALLLLLVPVVTVGLGVLAPFPAGLLAATGPVLLAVLAGAGSPLVRHWAVVIAVLAPATAALVVTPLVQPYFDGAWRMPAATALWAAMLAVTLLSASRFRARTAAAVAGLGGLAACWAASTLAILPHAIRLGLNTSFAPLWYPAHILSPLTVPVGDLPPDPNFCMVVDDVCVRYQPALWQLMDFTEGYPQALTITTAYAAAYVIASAATIGAGHPIGATPVPGRPGTGSR